VSRSGFWADDFLNVIHFNRTLGDISDNHINTGKYVINIFWATGTEAFGTGSVAPFLMLNMLVFAAGLVMWLRAGIGWVWGLVDACWIGGLFIAAAAWMPTVLWSSNITHSGGFLALGVGMIAHRQTMGSRTTRGVAGWSLVGGFAWVFAVVSNLIYIGLMPIAAYCTWWQIQKLRPLGFKTRNATFLTGSWNVVLPLVYFAAVAYPGTKSSSAYASTGLRFLHENLRYYRLALAPSALLIAVYGGLLTMAVSGSVVGLRRRDFFPMAVLSAACATAIPALVQGQQRYIHYVAMPLLLLFSAAVLGCRLSLSGRSHRVKYGVLCGACISLLLIFQQAWNIRDYFIKTPYGSTIKRFRSEVASLAPEGGVICARLDLDDAHRALFIAALSGEDGFRMPPISAAQVSFTQDGKPCATTSPPVYITVGLGQRGEFVAHGGAT
jgi:hypothetical protein